MTRDTALMGMRIFGCIIGGAIIGAMAGGLIGMLLAGLTGLIVGVMRSFSEKDA